MGLLHISIPNYVFEDFEVGSEVTESGKVAQCGIRARENMGVYF